MPPGQDTTEKERQRRRSKAMPRGPNRYRWAKKPSILADLQALCAEPARDWVPPRRRSAKALEQQRRAIEAQRKRYVIGPKPKIGDRLKDRMLRVMRPGEWYAMRDIARAATGKRGRHCAPYSFPVIRMFRDGMLERVPNPQWDPVPRSPQHCARHGREPKWLYRMTLSGEALRSVVILR